MESVAELRKLGKYELVEVVGHGEMGTVYRAIDPATGEQVAIKSLHPEVAAIPGLARRFTDAILAAINLRHANIVVAHDIGEDDGIPYVVTEFLSGQALDKFAATHSEFTPVQMIGTFVQICNALHYAHEQGMIHGGLKPANVIVLQDGSVKLTDFGVALSSLSHTTPGSSTGRNASRYASPEQVSGKSIDHRSDVFSSSVMLFQLLADDLPFATGTDPVGPPPPLSRYLQDYPKEMDRIMARALAVNPQDRYADSAEMAADLSVARDAFKQILVEGYVEYARTSISHSELETAREVLDSLREIDDQLPVLKELMDEIQRRQDPQWIAREVATLRDQAERALAEKRLADAARLVDEALQLDASDAGLLSMRAEIHEAESTHQTAESLLDKAESALQARKLEEARTAVDKALRLEPQNARAANVLTTLVRQAGDTGRQPEKTHPPDAAPPSVASAMPTIPGSLSIGILSGPATASVPSADRDTTGLGRFENSSSKNSTQVRLQQALRNPRILAVAAAVILVLGFAIAAGVRSKHRPKPQDTSGQALSPGAVPAITTAGTSQELASNAPGVSPGGTTSATPVAPTTEPVAVNVPSLAASSDVNCDWNIDGKPQEPLKQGDQKLVAVSAGKHRIVATSLDGLDQWKTDITVGKTEQKTLQIKLNAVVQKRLDKLQAEQKSLADAEEERKKQAEADAEKQSLAKAAEEAENKRRADSAAAAEKQRQAEAEMEQKRAADAEAAQKQAADEAEQKRRAALNKNLWEDPATGLWWAKRDNGNDVNWRQAQTYCNSLTVAGYSHWRLPTIDELQGIYDPGLRGVNRVRGGLQTSGGYSYWTNTREGSGQAWTFNFAGTRYPNQLEYHTTTRAICVRKGE
ncbi:MAG: protein kinase [Terriglobales bacterium]|jgi:serine/threonine protein kinase